MNIALVVLKSGEQILSDVEMGENGIVTCYRPMLIGWVRPDKKLTRILMTLTVFPVMIGGVTNDLSGHFITLIATDLLCIVREEQLKTEAMEQYGRESVKAYSGIEVVSGMPQEMKGEA